MRRRKMHRRSLICFQVLAFTGQQIGLISKYQEGLGFLLLSSQVRARPHFFRSIVQHHQQSQLVGLVQLEQESFVALRDS